VNGSPIPSAVNVLRSRQAALTDEEQHLLDRLQEVRATLARTREQLQQAELADERSRVKGNGVPVEA
jgi:prefoldin subunit 5